MGRALELIDHGHGQIGRRDGAGLGAIHQRLVLAYAVLARALAPLVQQGRLRLLPQRTLGGLAIAALQSYLTGLPGVQAPSGPPA